MKAAAIRVCCILHTANTYEGQLSVKYINRVIKIKDDELGEICAMNEGGKINVHWSFCCRRHRCMREVVDWISLAEGRDSCWAFIKSGLNPEVPENTECS